MKVKVRDDQQLYRIAHAAGLDAGNRSMERAGRKKWSRADYNAAARAFDKIMQGR